MEDGMHVFGETPQGNRRAQFIASIVRYDAGQADSLRKRLCTAQGFELETLLAEPGGVDKWKQLLVNFVYLIADNFSALDHESAGLCQLHPIMITL